MQTYEPILTSLLLPANGAELTEYKNTFIMSSETNCWVHVKMTRPVLALDPVSRARLSEVSPIFLASQC